MRRLLVPLIFVAALECVSLAQPKPPAPEMSLVVGYKIKPDMRAEFEAVQKEMSAAFRKAEVPMRMVLQTVLGDMTEYVAVTPLANFGAMDGTGPMVRALGQEAATKLQRRGAALITSAHRVAAIARPDLSINTQDEMPGEYALVITLTPAPGRSWDLDELMKTDILAACKKAGVKHLWVSEVVFGGTGGSKVVVMPASKMAAFDMGSPMQRALGPEGAKKLAMRMAPMVASTEYVVMRMRPDLSHMGQAPAQ